MPDRMEELVERGVAALEKLADDEIQLQVETKPPICPHCNTINPNIRVEINGTGTLVEFFIQAHCLACNNVFYVLPFQWDTVKTVDEVRAITEEKVALGGYQSNGNN
jgi:hypothetical protein